MKTSLDHRKDYLCVLTEREVRHGPHIGLLRQWYPVHRADRSEVRALLGLPVTQIDSGEGVYADEEGNVFRLVEGWGTKAIEVEQCNGKLEDSGRTREELRSMTAFPPWRKARAQITAAEPEGTEDPRFKRRLEWSAATQARVRK